MITPGTTLGIYRLIEPIGAGGMGEVWKAEDTRLGRVVAVKVLPQAIASDAEAMARIRREARTVAQLNHPNIAHVYAFEEAAGRLYIAMEFVEGEPLSKLIERGPMAEADVCRVGRGIADALAEAHAKGIIHRDIKPDNVLVAGQRVKVLDFGIAKHIGPRIGSNDPTAVITQVGMIVGTINYMSPEQALGRALDPRTDIFSLGVVLYQAATGQLPFRGETVTETMTRIIRDEPADPLSLRPMSPQLAAIITKCLRKDPGERYDTAARVAGALESVLPTDRSIPAAKDAGGGAPPKRRVRAIAATAVILGTVVAFGLLRKRENDPPVASAPAAAPEVRVAVTPPVIQPTATVETVAPPPKPEPAPKKAVERPQSPDELFGRGLAALVDGNNASARRSFAAAVAADPNHRKANLGLAITDQNWKRARQLARDIVKDDPDDRDVQRLREFIVDEVDERKKKRRSERFRSFPVPKGR